MIRADMISTVGREYLASNIENDEYSYPKAFAAQSLTFNPIRNKAGRAFEKLDIRFVKDNVTVLIETKQNFTKADEEQLSAYVEYEKALKSCIGLITESAVKGITSACLEKVMA